MSVRLIERSLVENTSPLYLIADSDIAAMQLTSLVGRETEIELISQMLVEQPEVRLLTLLGPGGIGKTRLALAVADNLAQSGEFDSGIFVISLANLREVPAVLPRIAQSLNISQSGTNNVTTRIKQYLNERGPLLLILDNCETVVEVGSQILDLLASCPNLKILITSRRILRVRGEQQFNVPPLVLPPLSSQLADSNRAELRNYPAVQLLVERARLVKPDFNLSADLSETIAKICHCLEGLPLAIELAAPRLRWLSPKTLLARLEQRLEILNGGSADMPLRHQTMQASLEWSYDLLNPPEQLLLKRLSIFAGSWSLKAMEAICGDEEVKDLSPSSRLTYTNIEEVLSGLIDQSLIVVGVTTNPDSPYRYRLLETIRQYAWKRLNSEESAEALHRLQTRHQDYYLQVAQSATRELSGPNQLDILARLEQNYNNFLAILSRSLTAKDADIALKLAGALGQYWWIRNLSEGQFWLEATLAKRTGPEDKIACANALRRLGIIAHGQGDFVKARTCFEECLQLYREAEDKIGIAHSLNHLASISALQNKLLESIALQEESLTLYRELNDRRGLASILNNLGVNYEKQCKFELAWQYLTEALQCFREIGHVHSMANILGNLGIVELELGLLVEARSSCLKSLNQLRVLGDPRLEAFVLTTLGQIEIAKGNLEAARSYLKESLRLFGEQNNAYGSAIGLLSWGHLLNLSGQYSQAQAALQKSWDFFERQSNLLGQARCLEGLAETAINQNQPARSVVLHAAAVSLIRALNMEFPPTMRANQTRVLLECRDRLEEPLYQALWEKGLVMSAQEAWLSNEANLIQTAMLVPVVDTKPPVSSLKLDVVAPLTSREVEVLGLLAQGLTNAQIGDQLVLSRHTVSAHLRSIFAKLGVTSRTAAVRFASDHALI